MRRAWVIFLALATALPVADAREEPKRESDAVASIMSLTTPSGASHSRSARRS
jgi:hypothetical protein